MEIDSNLISTDFNANKEYLKRYEIYSKSLRNKIAGYLVVLKKNEKRIIIPPKKGKKHEEDDKKKRYTRWV